MRKLRWWGALAGGCASWCAVAGLAQERTGDVLWGTLTFGNVHGVMRSLEDEIETTQKAFLHAETATLDQQAEIIMALVGKLIEAFPKKKPDTDVEVWQAAWDISKDARMMQSNLRHGDYRGAYRSFNSLTNRCLTCHQQRRVWARFTTPADLTHQQ